MRAALSLLLVAATAYAHPRVLGPVRVLRMRGARAAVSVRVAGGAAALAKIGVRARGVGDLAFAELAPDEVAKVAALPSVRAIEPARRLYPSLDRSVAATGAPAARADFGLDGRGAVVGIVDTGCDFRHADLRAADGTTRIAALLDVAHERDGRHADLPDYGGAVWLRDEIDAQLAADAAGTTPAAPVLARDVDGHGTHVAGIAASGGLATGGTFPAGRYAGMAPAATLVCAAAAKDGHSFDEVDVLAGVRFAFDRARDLGMPAVVNLSLSGEGGPHDGTTNLEQAIDALVGDGAGRAVVVAAGNGGARDFHAGGWALDGHLELPVLLDKGVPAAATIQVDLWFSDPPPTVTVVAPDGTTWGPVAAGGQLAASAIADAGVVSVDDASGGVDPMNGRYEAFIEVMGNHDHAPAAGTWRILLDGKSSRWDAWMEGALAGAGTPRFTDWLDSDERGQLPAFARSAISVGSFVTKGDWTTFTGEQVARGTVAGRASAFSGTGPAADGRFFPDVIAPGDFVASALSRDAPPSSPSTVFYVAGDPGYLWADDGVHALLRGTSQAAPHVAGAVALLYQLDPSLTPGRLRELLRTSAAVGAGTPGWSPREGFGRLDVAAAARLLERMPAGAVDPAASTVGVSRDALPPWNGPVVVTVVPRDASGAPLGPGHAVTVDARDTASGAPAAFAGAVTDAGEGRYERVLLARGARGDGLLVTAAADGVPLAEQPTVWLVLDRSEIGAPFAARGGCALAPVPVRVPVSAAVAVAALVLLLVFRATRRPPRRSYR